MNARKKIREMTEVELLEVLKDELCLLDWSGVIISTSAWRSIDRLEDLAHERLEQKEEEGNGY